MARCVAQNARKQVEGRTDATAMLWLADVKAQLKAEYPGFATIREQIPSRLPMADQITQLEQLANERLRGDPEAGRGTGTAELPGGQGQRSGCRYADRAQRQTTHRLSAGRQCPVSEGLAAAGR